MTRSPLRSSMAYDLRHTTPDLLKFQLQEEHRNSQATPGALQSSFHSYLQEKLEDGDISVEEVMSSESEDDTRKVDYLNLKVLIENSAFELQKVSKTSILSLNSVKYIKDELEDKKDLRNYYMSRVSMSQQLISTVVASEDLDNAVLIKILKSNNDLHQHILQLNNDIESLTAKLNLHNQSCLLLGYIEDVKVSKEASPSDETSAFNSVDKFVSYIASVAVQRKVNLPLPVESDSIASKFEWIQNCVESLLADSEHDVTQMTEVSVSSPRSASFMESSFISTGANDPNRTIFEYKTALNDLRFSHQYLVKEFEHSRESSMKTISDYRRKISQLEKDLKSKDTKYPDSDAKDKEIAKLRKELSGLKIDNMGRNNSSSNVLEPPSPERRFDESEPMSRPPSGTMSNGILRKEFKKIVTDLQDQYELELSEERVLRKKLQDELDSLKQ